MGSDRPRQLRWVGPIALLVVGAAVVAAAWMLGTGDTPEKDDTPDPIEVDAQSAYDFDTIEAMASASDLVVRAHVVATRRAETVGADGTDPAAAAIVVREVTLGIDEVLGAAVASAGTGAEAVRPGDRISVVEEGWTTDGAPLIVDGLAPSSEGDDGIWFLQRTSEDPTSSAGTDAGDAPAARYLVINSQGRYLIDGEQLRGAENDDPLVATVEQLRTTDLITSLRG